jgi:hypothetical protein
MFLPPVRLRSGRWGGCEGRGWIATAELYVCMYVCRIWMWMYVPRFFLFRWRRIGCMHVCNNNDNNKNHTYMQRVIIHTYVDMHVYNQSWKK